MLQIISQGKLTSGHSDLSSCLSGLVNVSLWLGDCSPSTCWWNEVFKILSGWELGPVCNKFIKVMNVTGGYSWETVSLAFPSLRWHPNIAQFYRWGNQGSGQLNNLHEAHTEPRFNLGLYDFWGSAVFTVLHFDVTEQKKYIFQKHLLNTFHQVLWAYSYDIFKYSVVHVFILYHFLSIYPFIHPFIDPSTGIFWVSDPLVGTRDTNSFALKDLSVWRVINRHCTHTPSSALHMKSLTPGQASSCIKDWLCGIPLHPKSATNLNNLTNNLLSPAEKERHLLFLLASIHGSSVTVPHFSFDEPSSKWIWDSGLANPSSECLWSQWLVQRWECDPNLDQSE